MTGKVIDSGANGTLLVLLPLALAMVVLFIAWPLFVGLFVLGLAWKLWQTYQWQQLSQKIDPIFHQLVQVNQGCLTVLDLSMKANLTGSTAKWYLERKAEEYGAVRRLYEDQSIVYYFLTASALGSIFDDSEPEEELELAPEHNPSPLITADVVDTQPVETQNISITTDTQEKFTSQDQEIKQTSLDTGEQESPPSNQTESILSSTPPPEEESPPDLGESVETSSENTELNLNQSELAKRLEVHSSTIGKRKSDPDFAIWSQTKDPDGIPWQYVEETKLFIPIELNP
jgi:hypothetical protein